MSIHYPDGYVYIINLVAAAVIILTIYFGEKGKCDV